MIYSILMFLYEYICHATQAYAVLVVIFMLIHVLSVINISLNHQFIISLSGNTGLCDIVCRF